MIDLHSFRISQADFDSIDTDKSQGENEVVVDKLTQECEGKPQDDHLPTSERIQLRTESTGIISRKKHNSEFQESIYANEAAAESKYEDINDGPLRDQAGKSSGEPGLPTKYRKYAFLLLLAVSLVSLIIGAIAGTIASLLLNQKEEVPQPVSIWTSWSNCSLSCGIGIRRRSRQCPKITGNSHCSVSTEDFDVCMNTTCQDGVWSEWTLWSPCGVTCDVGVQSRSRDCQNFNETRVGSSCPGESSETKLCFMPACGAAVWTTWSSWNSCSVTCDIGVQTRTRDCQTYSGTLLGSSCPGISSEATLCYSGGCRHGGWSTWEIWSSCDRTCGGGIQTSARLCNNPSPSILGNPCRGSTLRAQTCNMAAC